LFRQSLDRIHRRTSAQPKTQLEAIRAQPATLIFLDAVKTIDELVRNCLSRKQDMAEALTTSDTELVEMGRADLIKALRGGF